MHKPELFLEINQLLTTTHHQQNVFDICLLAITKVWFCSSVSILDFSCLLHVCCYACRTWWCSSAFWLTGWSLTSPKTSVNRSKRRRPCLLTSSWRKSTKSWSWSKALWHATSRNARVGPKAKGPGLPASPSVTAAPRAASPPSALSTPWCDSWGKGAACADLCLLRDVIPSLDQGRERQGTGNKRRLFCLLRISRWEGLCYNLNALWAAAFPDFISVR